MEKTCKRCGHDYNVHLSYSCDGGTLRGGKCRCDKFEKYPDEASALVESIEKLFINLSKVDLRVPSEHITRYNKGVRDALNIVKDYEDRNR